MSTVLIFQRVLLFVVIYSTLLAGGNIDTFVSAAKSQIGRTTTYDPSYIKLKFPGGDIPISRGVCTDVVVRALRVLHIDLQQRIYNDKKAHPSRYKSLYNSDKPDPNIDHRRVRNIQAYLAARGYRVKGAFRPGDVVVWKLPISHLDHIGICSNKLNHQGEPLIIHNVGAGAREEDVLRAYHIVDHFRLFRR